MKKRVITTNKENSEKIKEEMSIFSYSLKETNIHNNKVKMIFVREKEINNDLLVLEDEYNSLKIPSIIPLIILMIITFVLLTALLVGVLIFKDENIRNIYLLAFGIPSAISFISLSGYYYFRTLRMNKFIAGGDKLKEEILNKAKELNNESNQ